MNELIYCMVGNLDRNNRSIQVIKKKLKTQAALNRNMTVTYVILLTLIGLLKWESLDRDAVIKKLSEEVKELKRKEGE